MVSASVPRLIQIEVVHVKKNHRVKVDISQAMRRNCKTSKDCSNNNCIDAILQDSRQAGTVFMAHVYTK